MAKSKKIKEKSAFNEDGSLTQETIVELGSHLLEILKEHERLVYANSPTISTPGWIVLEEEQTAILQMSWKDPVIAGELAYATYCILQEYVEEGYLKDIDDIFLILQVLRPVVVETPIEETKAE